VSSNPRPIDAQLRRWQEAGLLDHETATRIRAFEESLPDRNDRPGIVEAAVYLGLAVIAVGIAVLVATNWQDLRPWARIAVSGVPALLALITGQSMRTSPAPGVHRGAQLAWLLALALLTSTAAIVGNESGWTEENIWLAAGLTALSSGVTLWVVMPTHTQLLGVAAGTFVFSLALQSQPDVGDNPVIGPSLALFGAAGVILTEFNLLVPRTSARMISSIEVVAGGLFAGGVSGPGPAEAIAFVAGACLIALSIRRGVFVYTGMGVASFFIGLVTLILRHIDNTTAASVALIAVGVVLLAGVLLLERFRPWARRSMLA